MIFERRRFFWLVMLLSMFYIPAQATATAKNFDAVEQYMRKNYIRGWHNSNYYPPRHETFVQDFATNQLFFEFKMALQSGDADAKRVFELVLGGLRECLSLEKGYGLRAKNQIRVFVACVGALSLLGALFNRDKAKKVEHVLGSLACAALVGFSYLPGDKTPEDSKKGKYGRVIDDLEKRIEFWLQILPGDNPGSVVTIQNT